MNGPENSVNYKVAFLGNQDNTAVFLADCAKSIFASVDVYLFEEEVHNLRCSPLQVGCDLASGNYHVVSRHNKSQLRDTLKKLEDVDFVLVTGNIAPVVVAQLDKPICYTPVGAYELNKFLTAKRFSLNDIRSIQRKQKLGFFEASKKAYQIYSDSKQYLKFRQNLSGVTSLGQGFAKLPTFSDLCLRLFPKAAQLICPEPMPVFDFVRDHFEDRFYAELTEKYKQYELVFFAPSRKWIDPDKFTGFTKRTDWIMEAFDKLSEEGLLDPQRHKIVWLSHGVDSERCEQYINRSQWLDAVDYYPHLNASQLWAVLKLQQCVVLDAFGDKLYPLLNGALRESLAFGTSVLTGNFDPKQTPYRDLYDEVPLDYCPTHDILVSRLRAIISSPSAYLADAASALETWEARYKPTEKLQESIIDIVNRTMSQYALNHKTSER